MVFLFFIETTPITDTIDFQKLLKIHFNKFY